MLKVAALPVPCLQDTFFDPAAPAMTEAELIVGERLTP
jgi:hypothetical protein